MVSLSDYRLMIPGPAGMDDEIVGVMGRPIAAHYGPDWAALFHETADLMKQTFVTKTADLVFLFCSGGGAVEASIASLFAPGEKVLVVNNGLFGDRFVMFAETLGLQHVSVKAEWGEPIDPEVVREALVTHPDIKGILAVQHETSTGVLNPIQAIGVLGQEFDVPVVVDAVASLAGDPFYMDEWGIDVCVTAANKCIAAPVGIAPVAISQRACAIMDSKEKTAAGWYLNLKTWRHAVKRDGGWHPTPVTMSSQNFQALNVALHKLLEEGLEERWRRYRATAAWFRAAMKEREFELVVEGDNASSAITAVRRLPDMDVAHFVNFLREQFQIQISGGLGKLHNETFRVGHIGTAVQHIVPFLQAVDAYKVDAYKKEYSSAPKGR